MVHYYGSSSAMTLMRWVELVYYKIVYKNDNNNCSLVPSELAISLNYIACSSVATLCIGELGHGI